jgi:hypothetical protein
VVPAEPRRTRGPARRVVEGGHVPARPQQLLLRSLRERLPRAPRRRCGWPGRPGRLRTGSCEYHVSGRSSTSALCTGVLGAVEVDEAIGSPDLLARGVPRDEVDPQIYQPRGPPNSTITRCIPAYRRFSFAELTTRCSTPSRDDQTGMRCVYQTASRRPELSLREEIPVEIRRESVSVVRYWAIRRVRTERRMKPR